MARELSAKAQNAIDEARPPMTTEQLAEAVEKNRPRPYDLTNPDELARLYRESWGYLHTCHHKHGTDWEGRKFAMDALLAMANRSVT